MCFNPSIFSLMGLVFDIIGFTLISYTIIYPPKEEDERVTDVQDAFGEHLFTNFDF